MEAAAYWVALVSVVAVLPLLLGWVIVHPFARFWRRLGPVPAYTIVLVVIGICGYGIFECRGAILRIHFGVRPALWLPAVPCFLAALWIAALRGRHLTPRIMFGLPELSKGPRPGKLLTEGIYARIRNPRYVESGLALAAIALFCDYLATYVLVVLYVPVIYVIVLLEERELWQRFGEEYERYCREVPRFVPRLRRRATASG